jgi:hypothetical protein
VNARLALESGHSLTAERRLSPEALHILMAASAEGKIYLLGADQLAYPAVRAGHCDFFSTEDALLGASYLEAFQSLVAADLARPDGGQLYLLSVRGLTLGRTLAAAMSTGHADV